MVRAEAENLGSCPEVPHVTGGFDDMWGLIKREDTPAAVRGHHAALHSNPDLKLWVVYTRLDATGSPSPFIDIANLWVWNAKDLPGLEMRSSGAGRSSREPELGCYLRDYPRARAHGPAQLQWQYVRQGLDQGQIDGFSILGTVLIDGQREQAGGREFIAAH